MNKIQLSSFVVILIVCLLSSLFALTGANHGAEWKGYPVFYWCVAIAFAIQWLAFIPAFLAQSERFYDATGSLTYILVVFFACYAAEAADPHSILLASLVVLWAVRLGSFLLKRILKDGSDSRFDDIKPVFFRFLLTWCLQAFWVTVTAGAALAAITSSAHVELDWLAILGAIIWFTGFSFEVIADNQKRFHKLSGDGQNFIRSGLWSVSRHPNYFGEIVLWLGVAIIALPALSGWQYVTLISPLFVWLLLTKVSGIPLLEAKSDKRWGKDPEYLEYKKNTPVLVPKLKLYR